MISAAATNEVEMATRKLVTAEELCAILHADVKTRPGGSSVTISHPVPYATPDADGVNWSPTVTYNAGKDNSAEGALPAVRDAVQAARAAFNLK